MRVEKYFPVTLATTFDGVLNVTVVPDELAAEHPSITPSPRNLELLVKKDEASVAPVLAVVVQSPRTPTQTIIPTYRGVVSETVMIGELAVTDTPDRNPTVFITVADNAFPVLAAVPDTTNAVPLVTAAT